MCLLTFISALSFIKCSSKPCGTSRDVICSGVIRCLVSLGSSDAVLIVIVRDSCALFRDIGLLSGTVVFGILKLVMLIGVKSRRSHPSSLPFNRLIILNHVWFRNYFNQ